MTITRRHHPLIGQRLEVLRGGRRKLVVRMVNGVAMHVPRAWTDADGIVEQRDWVGAVFSVESIREVLALVDAMQRRSAERPST